MRRYICGHFAVDMWLAEYEFNSHLLPDCKTESCTPLTEIAVIHQCTDVMLSFFNAHKAYFNVHLLNVRFFVTCVCACRNLSCQIGPVSRPQTVSPKFEASNGGTLKADHALHRRIGQSHAMAICSCLETHPRAFFKECHLVKHEGF